jgi:deazaflavin-dependent oxidoreductase (nitroreductase family)
MTNENQQEALKTLLAQVSNEDFCYLTTTGRVSGRPHEIEIWFGLQHTSLYLLSGGMDKADWVKNLLKDPSVHVRIANRRFVATARLVKDEKEERIARTLLADKYHEREDDNSLSEWARTALPVAIDIHRNALQR